MNQPTTISPKPRRPWVLWALCGVFCWVLIIGTGQLVKTCWHKSEPAAPASPAPVPVNAATAQPVGWTAVPADSPLNQAVDVAFAGGGFLATDGKMAFYDAGDGLVRPVDVPVPVNRVFGAAGKLFAAGENEGAPFFIRLVNGETPLVVPMPCRAEQLAGEIETLAAACDDARHVAISRDGGRNFRLMPVALPRPPVGGETEVEHDIESIAAGPGGVVGIAASQRWLASQEDHMLLWTWGQVATKTQNMSFRFSNVHALVRSVGLFVSGGVMTLAGLEATFDGPAEGELRARLFRGADDEPPLPVGEAGPKCGYATDAKMVDGVLLGTQIAAFLCQGHVVLTLDSGISWKTDPDLTSISLLRGGDMRLLVRGPQGTWERRFFNRSETGATAVRVMQDSLPVPGTVIDMPTKTELSESMPRRTPADATVP